MEGKYTERFYSFCNSLEALKKARTRDLSDDFVLSGTVQKFSLTFDISWKVMKDILVKYHGITNFATSSPRETLRTAASVGLISDDQWMHMLEDRNELVHDYDGKLAQQKVSVIVNEYTSLFEKFQCAAMQYIDKMKKM